MAVQEYGFRTALDVSSIFASEKARTGSVPEFCLFEDNRRGNYICNKADKQNSSTGFDQTRFVRVSPAKLRHWLY